ncbi:MAG TPA: long-chain-fatty-acid--CoA ligase [Acidimicrobiales bacterium]|nr:long-chain-fatty-acid--CoA ligase [Acidimicrobiales bacterium]
MSATWTLAGVVRDNRRLRPDAVAVAADGSTMSWVELDRRSNRVATALARAGVGPGDRVAFVDKNSPEYFEVLFGAAKLGAVTVAVNWRLAPPEMGYIVGDAGAPVLAVAAEFARLVPSMGLSDGVEVVAGDEYESWLGPGDSADPGHEASPGDVALQLYTSGTTGLPKGVMLTQSNFEGLLGGLTRAWRLDETSVNLVAMPLFHIGGSGWALAGMTAGATSVVVREVVPDRLVAEMERLGVTNAFLVPAVLSMLAAVPGARERDWSALRCITYGASPITDDALVKAMDTFRCDFAQLYGLTETTGAITQLDPADHDPNGPRARLLRSAGRPYPWVALRVVDPETGAEVPTGSVGEVCTSSAQNMAGYWNNPTATGETVDAEGWLRTGDAGLVDAEGYLFLTDRIKDMIVSGGENVFPAEVENVLAAHPGVADVAVIGVPHERWGETVKAVVVAAGDAPPDGSDLIAFARERLAHFKCPTSVDFVDVLPRNPSGKVLKRELREPYWRGLDRHVN